MESIQRRWYTLIGGLQIVSEQRDNRADRSKSTLPGSHQKVDKRYRESKHFLMDQLRYADSVQDFRTVKHAILRSTQFSIGQQAFQFARVHVEVNEDH